MIKPIPDQNEQFWAELDTKLNRDMYLHNALGYVMWGLLIVIFDFRINGFNLLWDLIGFLLILKGLINLDWKQPVYSWAIFAVCGLVILSIPDLFVELRHPVFLIIGLPLVLVFVLIFFEGLRGIAEDIGKEDLATNIKGLRTTTCIVLGIVGINFLFQVSNTFTTLLGIVGIVLFIINIMYIWLVRNALAEL